MYQVSSTKEYEWGTKVQNGFVELLKAQGHNVAVHLAFNSNVEPTGAREALKKFMARANRTIVGGRWNRRNGERIKGMFFMENMRANLLFHGSVRIANDDAWEACRTMAGIWKELVEKGSSDIGPIRNETACFIYNTKDLRSADALDNWINTEDFWK